MEVLFQDQKLEKMCRSESLLTRKYGPEQTRFILRRLEDFASIDHLATLRSLPQARCHELKGNKEGTLAVDLKHPYRLIFEPANEPLERKPDGGLDWTKVTVIRILTVEDYHG